MKVWLALFITIGSAGSAEAGPVITAIGAIATAISTAAASSALAGWLIKTALSVALSQLAMMIKGKPRPPGITTETTTSGGTTPQKFILGLYASGGQMIAPPNSYGVADKTPRAYLVYPVALSVIPGCTLQRVIINDAYVTLAASGATWGRPATGDLAAVLTIDYRDGSQTFAHADMLTAFGTDPDRPWGADMVGPGTAYALARFKYDRELFNGLPTARFEILGIPLYDPRFDSTVGGSGAQRWATRSTWAQTVNPMVMVYNILRGIDVGAGMIWGGECAADDLPLAKWFAAMNECDLAVPAAGGGTEPQYRAGIEVALEDEPAAVIEELLKTCVGQLVEVGGVWSPRVGGPAMPSYFLTDDDLVISRDQEFAPFPSLTDTFNGITSTYPEPESLWEAKEAPPRYSATWETEDGGRRLVADVSLPACPYPGQVQRLMGGYIADHRRMRRHQFVLPPEAAVLEPLETVGWTSTRFGYTDKVFEITALTDGLVTMQQAMAVRERDSGDFAWVGGDYLATSLGPVTTSAPAAQAVPGWAVAAEVIVDASALARRPAIRLSWDADGADDATGLMWELRLVGAASAHLSGIHAPVSSGTVLIAEGLLPSTAYEVRAQFIVDRATVWTGWTSATTGAVPLGQIDLDGSVVKGVLVGPVDIPTTVGYTFLTIATGAISPHQLWRAGVSAELKHTSGSAAVLAFERRYKFAGTWGPWLEAGTMTTTTVWDVDGVSSGFAGQYDDAEFRLSVKSNGGVRPLSLRNVHMTATNIVKS